MTWAQRPPATGENYELALRPSIQAQFEAWLATTDGARFFAAFVECLLADLRDDRRISAKAAWEQTRRQTRLHGNNNFHALAMRRAEDLYPALRGRAEKRKRSAA